MKDKKELINLDEAVVNALNFFKKRTLPNIKLPVSKNSIIIGSGNATIVARIMFNNTECLIADETNFVSEIQKNKKIKEAVIISSSGKKDVPEIVSALKKKKMRIVLLTCNENSPSKKLVSRCIVFPHLIEPYTYNVSGYLGMILSQTKENPNEIMQNIKKIKILLNLKKYSAFYIIIPEKFALMREMFLTKFDEIFGSEVCARAYTFNQTKHAKTIIPSEKELFISLGVKNKIFGKHKLEIPIKNNSGLAEMMCAGYYVIGNIQKQHPPYFKNNIEKYVKTASKIFNHKIGVME